MNEKTDDERESWEEEDENENENSRRRCVFLFFYLLPFLFFPFYPKERFFF